MTDTEGTASRLRQLADEVERELYEAVAHRSSASADGATSLDSLYRRVCGPGVSVLGWGPEELGARANLVFDQVRNLRDAFKELESECSSGSPSTGWAPADIKERLAAIRAGIDRLTDDSQLPTGPLEALRAAVLAPESVSYPHVLARATDAIRAARENEAVLHSRITGLRQDLTTAREMKEAAARGRGDRMDTIVRLRAERDAALEQVRELQREALRKPAAKPDPEPKDDDPFGPIVDLVSSLDMNRLVETFFGRPKK